MAREKKDNVIITFRIPKQVASDLDEEIARWNEEKKAYEDLLDETENKL